MPGYKGHIAGGIVVSIPLVYVFSSHATLFTATTWFLFSIAGALFPDVDTKSKGQKWFYRIVVPVLFLFLLIKRFLSFTVLALIAFLPLLVNHRGVFHRLWFVTLPPIAIVGFLTWYKIAYFRTASLLAVFFVAGAISHLVLDFGFSRTFKGL